MEKWKMRFGKMKNEIWKMKNRKMKFGKMKNEIWGGVLAAILKVPQNPHNPSTVVYYCVNNVVRPTMLFTIVSTMLFNQQCCLLLFQQCCSLLFQQCCSINNVVYYCFNNVVHHWWSNNGCSRLLKQEKIILIEQACSLLLSLLLNFVNKL